MRKAIWSLIERFTKSLIGFIHDDPRFDPRTSPATKLAMILAHYAWQAAARRGDPLPDELGGGARIYSQFEEDGILLYLDAVLEIENKIFLDIGAADGINSNCANLALNLGYTGVFIDDNKNLIERGQRYYAKHPDSTLWPPKFVEAFIARENINELITEAGLSGQIGVMSIDIDGNDYWVWEAIEVVDPAVVVIETHIEFGMRDIVVPYDADYIYPGKHPDYFSASPVAMVKLAKRKGYRLVGANRYGFNLFFVKYGLHEDRVPEVSLESVLQHPRHFSRLDRFEAVKDWVYVTPE
jgi:hypothetical protein